METRTGYLCTQVYQPTSRRLPVSRMHPPKWESTKSLVRSTILRTPNLFSIKDWSNWIPLTAKLGYFTRSLDPREKRGFGYPSSRNNTYFGLLRFLSLVSNPAILFANLLVLRVKWPISKRIPMRTTRSFPTGMPRMEWFHAIKRELVPKKSTASALPQISIQPEKPRGLSLPRISLLLSIRKMEIRAKGNIARLMK